MSTKLVDRFQETLKSLPEGKDAIKISIEDSYKICEKINNEMKEYRREFTKKEKDSHRAASEILLTSQELHNRNRESS